MESAFGIDHGEVSKAFGVGALGSAMARKTTQVGSSISRGGAKVKTMGRQNMAANPAGSYGFGVGQGQMFNGGQRMKAGGALKKLGAGMAKKPGLTGGVAVGGGAAGVGAAGGMFANRQRRF